MPTLPSRIPTKLRPRVDFDPEKFRKFILMRGLNVEWEMAARCPCSRLSTDVSGTSGLGYSGLISGIATHNTAEAHLECTECKGSGWLRHSKQTIKALVHGAKNQPQPAQILGDLQRGETGFTLLPEHLPSLYDTFRLLDSTIIFHEILTRGSTVISKTRYPIASRTLDLSSGTQSRKVLVCRKADSNGRIVAGELVEGTDFQINASGQIDWTIGDALNTAPTSDQRFSVSYYCHPVYVVIDIPNVLRDTIRKTKAPTAVFQDLPVQCLAKLDFLETP